MKKFFLFAAAAIAALTVNAKVVDLTAIGTTIDQWTVGEATLNETESKPADGKYVYDIKGGVLFTRVSAMSSVVRTVS